MRGGRFQTLRSPGLKFGPLFDRTHLVVEVIVIRHSAVLLVQGHWNSFSEDSMALLPGPSGSKEREKLMAKVDEIERNRGL